MKFYHIIFGLLFIAFELNGQDIHFSQFYQTPMQINPALTGMTFADFRFTANYRNQWASVSSNPYVTMSGNVDGSIFVKRLGDLAGWGVGFVRDVAGDGDFQQQHLMASAAYRKSLGKNLFLGLGGNLTWSERSIKFSQLYFDNQYNGVGFDTNIPSGEQKFGTERFNYLDFSAGAMFGYVPIKNVKILVGMSLHHLNQPNVNFYDREEFLYQRVAYYIGGELGTSKSMLSVLPQFYFQKQGELSETIFGALLKLDFTYDRGDDAVNFAIYGGVLLRSEDAYVPVVQVDYRDLTISLSQDINISKLVPASRGIGGPELTIKYKIFGKTKNSIIRDSDIKCPYERF